MSGGRGSQCEKKFKCIYKGFGVCRWGFVGVIYWVGSVHFGGVGLFGAAGSCLLSHVFWGGLAG